MMIISKTTADTAGSVTIGTFQVTGDYESQARISRTKTLDGSSCFIHHGVSETDRTVTIDCRLTEAQFSTLKSIYEDASAVRISYWQGYFEGYMKNLFVRRNGTTKIQFYLIEDLTS